MKVLRFLPTFLLSPLLAIAAEHSLKIDKAGTFVGCTRLPER